MMIFHDPRCTDYGTPGHPERPARIAGSAPILRKRHVAWPWPEVVPATDEMVLRAHAPEHLDRIRDARSDFDADTAAHPGIFAHAIRATGAAVQAARHSLGGGRAFSLMRPPGHHATRHQAMGFCYFNHVAIAALDALEQGAERVAIWDFDAHHGNGTEAIVAHHPRIALASIHQFPAYPGTGGQSFANVTNLPIPPMSARAGHVDQVRRGLDRLLEFKPSLLLVSAGFDAYRDDPITQMTLEREDFATFGEWLGQCGVPAGAILEGGYSDELPELIDAFLTAWDS
jgi:acetoin utilization deacetylase AcuC-like enzyme